MKRLSTRWLVLAVTGVLIGAPCYAQSVTPPTEAQASATPKVKAKTTKAKTTKAKTTRPKTTRVRGTANARILHAVKGAPAVDVYVDGNKVLTGADYKSVSDYVALPSGKRNVKITPTGKSETLLNGSVSLSKDRFFTLAMHGTPDKPQLMRINETTGKMFEGKSKVFVTHLAQAPAVDVTTASTRTKSGYATFVKSLEPGKTRAKTTSPGEATLQVRASGAVLENASARIEPGKRYSVFALGTPDALELLVKPAAVGFVETIVPVKPRATKTKKSATPAPTTVASASTS